MCVWCFGWLVVVVGADGASETNTTDSGGASGGGGGDVSVAKKKLHEATHDELMSLVKHHSSRLKVVEEEYMKLKRKVCYGAYCG